MAGDFIQYIKVAPKFLMSWLVPSNVFFFNHRILESYLILSFNVLAKCLILTKARGINPFKYDFLNAIYGNGLRTEKR